MAVFTQAFDATTVEPSKPFEPLPDDTYPMAITESKWERTKADDGTYLELVFEVVDGPFKGRKVWERLNLDNKSAQTVEIAQRSLSAICHATGVMQVRDSSQLHNIPLAVKVTVKQGTKGPTNEVRGYAKLASAPLAVSTPVGPAAALPAQAPWMKKSA